MRKVRKGTYVFYLAVFLIGIILDFYYDRDIIKASFYAIKPLFKVLSFLGLGGTQLFLLCIVIGISYMQSIKPELRYKLKISAITGMIAVILSGISAQALKHIIGRPRPRFNDLWGIVGPTLINGFDSLPSGHTTTSFALAVVTSCYFPKMKLPMFIVAFGVAISRIGLGSHYPLDVSVGIILGMMTGALISNYFIQYSAVSPLPKKLKMKDKAFHYIIYYSDEKTLHTVKKLIEVQNKIPPNLKSKGIDETTFALNIGFKGYQIHQSKWATVIKPPDVRPFYFKVFRYYGIKQMMPLIMYPSKSYRFYIASNYLSNRGFNTPKVISYGKLYKGIFLKKCFLFYEGISGIPVSEILSKDPHELSINTLFKCIAHKLNECHRYGIYHGDLRPQNIFIENNEEIGFIDLDKVKITNANNISLIIRDLAKLNNPALSITAFGRLRFFVIYLKNNAFLWQKRRSILKRVLKYSSKVYLKWR